MGDVVRGTWYDTDGLGRKNYHWDKILPIALSGLSTLISIAALCVALVK